MARVYLIVAGVLEIGWAVGLKLSHGLSLAKPLHTGLTVAAMAASVILLGLAAPIHAGSANQLSRSETCTCGGLPSAESENITQSSSLG